MVSLISMRRESGIAKTVDDRHELQTVQKT